MPDKTFVIAGRIFRKDGSGVHGLIVDIYDRDLLFYETLGTVRTNRYGVFQFEYGLKGFEALFDAEPEIVLSIQDESGKKLHTVENGAICRLGEVANFDIELPDDLLKDHLAKSRSLSPEGGSLLPQRHLQTIADAWTRLARNRGDQRTFDKNWVLRAGPPIIRFDNLVNTAMGVIEGRPEDVQRFVDLLTVMETRSGLNTARGVNLASISDKQLADISYWKSLEGNLAQAMQKMPAPGPPIIPSDEFIAVATAAFLVAGNDLRGAHHNLRVVLTQIFNVLRLEPVVHAAEKVGAGGPEALQFFEEVWSELIDNWKPSDGPQSPLPDGDPTPDPNSVYPLLRPYEFPSKRAFMEKATCAVRIVLLLQKIFDHTYTITSVDNPRACPGDSITINGFGFGSVPGKVNLGGTEVDPISWSGTSITVVVPEDAGYGALSLVIYAKPVQIKAL